jgi:hypothetical protein
MKYYKSIFSGFDPQCEYYCVEANNKPFWWYYYVKGEWRHTTTDGFSKGETWEHWKSIWRSGQKSIQKVSKLEVLVVCGSVKE